ncbi:RES domain protein [compost metagenome]
MLIQPISITQHLYRARGKTARLNAVITEFDFPPARFVGEGRYNHAGGPVLYIASDLETCKAETRDANILAVKFKIDTPLKVFDLTSDFRDIREHQEL